MTLIQTALGEIRGLALDAVDEFRGVPFAQPPVAEKRFLAPEPITPWSEVYEATEWPAIAWQKPVPLMGLSDPSEDCLYLNIWKPKGEGPFAVMVWFHGGGYISGSPSQMLYSGRELAAQQQVVVVNVSYRLGAMGFADFSQVAPDLPHDLNRGLRDQVAGLRWVNEHIQAFGGDAKQITIFGESAGGWSVASIMACPHAKGLFQRAIIQSGGADYALPASEAQKVSAALMLHLHEGAEDEGVEAKSAEELLLSCDRKSFVRAQNKAAAQTVNRAGNEATPLFGTVYMPVIDGDWVPDVPVNVLASGACNDVPVLAGVCKDEWNLFQYSQMFNGGQPMSHFQQLDEAELAKRFQRALPQHTEAALNYYTERVEPHPKRSILDVFSTMESDRYFVEPTIRLLDAHCRHGGEGWAFCFTWEVEMMGVPMGACHVVDVPFVFGLVNTAVGQMFTGGGDEAAKLEADVMAVWGDFARGNMPSVDWPQWQQQRQAKCFGPGTFIPLMDDDGESLWRSIMPALPLL